MKRSSKINKYSLTALLFLISSAVLLLSDPAFAQEKMMTLESSPQWRILNIIKKGGVIMYPLIFSSILALGIALERSYNLRRKKILNPEFLKNIRKHWQKQEAEKAIEVCQQHDVSLARILKAGLFRFNYGIIEIERAIEGAGQHEASLLNSNLRMLGVVANLTPMLGLLGTVLGMIKAFAVISHSGTGNPGLVANGISEALISTATGLTIGIPTLALYHYFRGKIDRFVFEMEEISLQLIEELVPKK
jgi:biopolymer transport protein ExbB